MGTKKKKTKKTGYQVNLVRENKIKQKPVKEKAPKSPLWIMTMVILGLLVLGLLGGYYYIIRNYTVTTVYVQGNVHYSNEEIMEMVMDGYYGDNSIFPGKINVNSTVSNKVLTVEVVATKGRVVG